MYHSLPMFNCEYREGCRALNSHVILYYFFLKKTVDAGYLGKSPRNFFVSALLSGSFICYTLGGLGGANKLEWVILGNLLIKKVQKRSYENPRRVLL